MLFPESWLRTLVNPSLSTEELAHRLTMAGLEIEDTTPVAPPFTGIVVAQIVSAEQHPNADKLRVCKVDDGSGQLLQIVCGAPNARAGIKVPLAQIGAVLPGDFKIKKSKLRGEESWGMLCSARELGISTDHAGLLELSNDLPVGQDIRQALDLDDTIFEIKLTPNRADCLSLYGVAREVSALTGAPIKPFNVEPVPATIQDKVNVTVQDADLCGRYAGRVIRGVNAKAPTPDYIKQRLERAGQRSVSALVDISNYVMLELGRPTHVFDLDKVKGDLTVRWAKAGETLTLLNEETITLDEKCGIILAGDTPESLAGVMGGLDTSVTLETQNIFVEAAFWFPEAIAGLTRRFKLNSEAAHRFERGVDFENVTEHLEYMTALILQVCGGQVGPVVDQIVNLPKREPVAMRLDRCNKVLGITITAEQVAHIFSQLHFQFQQQGNVFTVTPPSFRFDLTIEEDLIEEVARIYGFENIPVRAPVATANLLRTNETVRTDEMFRHIMADLDYQEVVNYSFVEEAWERDYQNNMQPIRLLNPIASQLAVMRSSLWGGLLANIQSNAKRKQSRVRVFELGRVFKLDPSVNETGIDLKGIDQPLHLAGAAWGTALPEQWGEKARFVDFFDVKNDVCNLLGSTPVQFKAQPHPALHPGRSAQLLLNDQCVGYLGELHPQWVQRLELVHAPVVFELDLRYLREQPLAQAQAISNQPVVIRDLAIWAPLDLSYQRIVDALKGHPDLALVQDIRLFDIWRDHDPHSEHAQERSLALRFVLQDPQATLEDKQVDECMKRILDILVTTFAVRQR